MLYYALFCVGFAYVNYLLIKKGRRIYHGLNGALHVSIAALIYFHYNLPHAIAALLMARVVFDWSLNLFRGLPLDYLPKEPKSIADKIEKELFENGFVGKIVYLFLILTLIYGCN